MLIMEEIEKKLYKAPRPEIQTPQFRYFLKRKLLEEHQKRGAGEIFFLKLRPAMAGAFIMIIFVMTFLLVWPQVKEAQALKIAKSHPQIQELIEDEKIRPVDVKLEGKKAYLLFLPSKKEKTVLSKAKEEIIFKIASPKEIKKEPPGLLAVVDLKRRRVEEIKKIKGEEILPLTPSEKETIKKILREEKTLGEIFWPQISIEKIEPVLPNKLKLQKRGKELKIISPLGTEKRVKVFYQGDSKKGVVQINLSEKKIEKIKITPFKK